MASLGHNEITKLFLIYIVLTFIWLSELTDHCLRDWSRSGGSYGNNTRVICCPAPGRPDKIHPKSPPNLVTSPTSLHCDVTHLSLTMGVVALRIPSWRIEVREKRRQAHKIVWPVNAGRVICRYQNNLCGIINHHKHIRYCFLDV